MLRVERDVEARLLGLGHAGRLSKEPAASVRIELGELSLREAMWALPAAEAARRLSASGLIRVRGQGPTAALYRAALGAEPGEGPAELSVNLSRPGARRARLRRGQGERWLTVPGSPRLKGVQHRAGEWYDGALCAGLPAVDQAPRLALPPWARRAGAERLGEATGGSWRAVVAWLPEGSGQRSVRRAARAAAERLGAVLLQVGGERDEKLYVERPSADPAALAALLSCCAVCVADDVGWAHVAAAAGAAVVVAAPGLDVRRRGPASALGGAVASDDEGEVARLAVRLAAMRFPADRLRRWGL